MKKFESNATEIQAKEKEKKSSRLDPAAWIMFSSLIIDLVGFTVILPLMPKLLDHYSSTGGSSMSFLESTVKTLQQMLNIPANFNSVMTGGMKKTVFYLDVFDQTKSFVCV